MKLTVKKIMALMIAGLMLIVAMPLNATAVTQDVLSYEVTNGKATIVSCDQAVVGKLTIPDTWGGYPVTRIGEQAFSGCEKLIGLAIPTSVTSIGNEAFQMCYALRSISIGAGNPAYIDENGVLFNKSKTELIQYPAGKKGSYSIPNSVKNIGDNAFSACFDLTSVTIPNSVKIIGNNAFHLCSAIIKVTIPDSVTSIGEEAFSDCEGLKSITIANSVTSIGDFAFSSCDGLTSIAIPDSVKSIGHSAFEHCYALKNIDISESVKSIGDETFSDCRKLTSINVSNANKFYSSENGVLFNKSKTELIRYPSNKTDSSYTVPNSVISIGKGAFDSCGLANIIIPDSVASIGARAFINTTWYDKQPDGVFYAGKVVCGYKGDIPDNTVILIKSGTIGIAEGAFELTYEEAQNSGMIGVSIPNTVTNIGNRAFFSCSELKSVTIPKSVVSIGEQAFGYWASLDYDEKISDLTFNCFANSAGLKYAKENGFKYKILPASAAATDPTVATGSVTTNFNRSTTAASIANNSDMGNKIIVLAVVLTAVVLLALAAIAVLVNVKKKKKP